MSIVGTRPPLISETNLYEPHHKATFIRLAAGQKDLAGIFTAEFNINTKSVHRFGNCIGQLRKVYIKLVHYFLRPLFLPRLRCCSSSRSIT